MNAAFRFLMPMSKKITVWRKFKNIRRNQSLSFSFSNPQNRGWQIPPKRRWMFTKLHDVTYHATVVLKVIILELRETGEVLERVSIEGF